MLPDVPEYAESLGFDMSDVFSMTPELGVRADNRWGEPAGVVLMDEFKGREAEFAALHIGLEEGHEISVEGVDYTVKSTTGEIFQLQGPQGIIALHGSTLWTRWWQGEVEMHETVEVDKEKLDAVVDWVVHQSADSMTQEQVQEVARDLA